MIFEIIKNYFGKQKNQRVEESLYSLPVVESTFFSEEELTKILGEHSVWLKTNGSFGKKASFNGMVIPSSNFFMADLKKADFQGSDLVSRSFNGLI